MKKTLLFSLGLLAGSLAFSQSMDEYKGYKFVAGEKILFQDDFSTDVAGKAPANWKIEEGSAAVKADGDQKYVSILAYYTKMSPKMKAGFELPAKFTLEWDMWTDAGYDGNPGVEVHFFNGESELWITPNRDQTRVIYPGGEQSGEMPENVFGEQFYNRWQHIAIAIGDGKTDVYVNQNHVVSAEIAFAPSRLLLTGNTSDNMPIYFRNFKLAEGGDAIGEALANGKFVSHGINFDVNKANIRPESMGVLSAICDFLKANPNSTFEIGGHTDSDGDEASNLKLSELRAEAVRKQLITMGAKPDQLTTKGYGESSPIDVNTTATGKAKNRRVEFVKK